MKYSSQAKQLRLDIFSGTLEKSPDLSNRWYKLANLIPWDKIERIYNKSLRNQHSGGGNKPARMVIGALIIKHKMNLSDSDWKSLQVKKLVIPFISNKILNYETIVNYYQHYSIPLYF